ncbi:MAG: glycerophosphodiester phosphodiesterase family protein [Marinifilaceae bacterium]
MKYFNTKKTILAGALCLSLLGLGACQDDTLDMNGHESADKIPMEVVTNKATLDVIAQLKKDAPNAVIAHRGSTFWTPEETEASYRWARNMGADYLELDVQRTKDGFLMALHDDNLRRTTNIESVYPGKVDLDVSNFTLVELRKLDAGTWFNEDHTDNARAEFANQKVSTLEDVIMIAKGNRVKREGAKADGKPFYHVATWNATAKTWTRTGAETMDRTISDGTFVYEVDTEDNGNRPGIYPETKEPWRFGGMEADLAKFLKKMNWLVTDSPEAVAITPGKVAIANTDSRVILQTFSWQSMQLLEKNLPNVPKCMLLWKGGHDNLAGDTPEMIADVMDFCVKNNVHIVGPSIGGKPNNYTNITKPWMCKMYHRPGFLIHAYSFDTQDQLSTYNGDYYYEGAASKFTNPQRKLKNEWNGKITPDMFIDAGFTNLTDLSLKYQGRTSTKTAEEVIEDLGYVTRVGRN